MILVNRCFSETTPESAELGDFSDTGFISENESVGFRELIDLIEQHPDCSEYPCNSPSEHTWFASGWFTQDYRTWTEREETLHYSKDNPKRNLKYWQKAYKIARNIK